MAQFVKIEGRVLHAALKVAATAIERRNTIPILGTVRLSIGANSSVMAVMATDLDIELKHKLDVIDAGDEAFALCIPVQAFEKFLAGSGAGIVTVRPGEHPETAVVEIDGDARATFNTLPPEDFPFVSTTEKWKPVERFTNGQLAELMGNVRWCVSTEETRYYLNGICWQNADGKKPLFVATDGHRLSAQSYGNEHDDGPALPEGDGVHTIIPSKTCDFILTHFRGKDVNVFSCERKLWFVSGYVELTSKLIDGTYPDWYRVVPTNTPNSLEIKKDDAIRQIRRAIALATERGRAVKFERLEDDVIVSVKNPDIGEAVVTLQGNWPEPGTHGSSVNSFGMNGRYVLDTLAHAGDNDVTIRYLDGGAPFVFDDGNEDRIVITMPMRV